MSTQSFGKGHLTKLNQIEFIPCKEKGDGILHMTWHKPDATCYKHSTYIRRHGSISIHTPTEHDTTEHSIVQLKTDELVIGTT